MIVTNTRRPAQAVRSMPRLCLGFYVVKAFETKNMVHYESLFAPPLHRSLCPLAPIMIAAPLLQRSPLNLVSLS